MSPLALHAGLKEPFLPPDGVCSSATQSCGMRGADYLPAGPSVGRFLMNPPTTPTPKASAGSVPALWAEKKSINNDTGVCLPFLGGTDRL